MTEYRKSKNKGGSAPKWLKAILCAVLALVLCMSALPTNSVAYAATVDEDAAGYSAEEMDEATGDEAGADETVIPADEAGTTEAGTEDMQGEQNAAGEDSYTEWTDDTYESGDALDAAGEEEIPEDELSEEDAEEETEEEDEEDAIMTLAVSGAAGISSFAVSAQVDGTAPWDGDDAAGDDSSSSNNIVRTFDYVNYTLAYTTELSDPTVTVNSGNVYVEFTLPCGPDVASFNMNTLNWMSSPVVTYYLSNGTTTTDYTNGMEVEKQVLTGCRTLENTSDNTAIPGEGTLSVGIYIGAATNGTTLKPEFTAWMDDNAEEDKVSVENQQTLTISAAQKYNINIAQASEMNISGTYDLSTGNGSAAKDTISGNTSVRGRMEGYGITVMMQNDSVDKGLKGLEFPSGDITFDITLSEQAENRNGNDLSSTAGYTPVIWDYDANLRKTVANGGSVGKWERTWVYTNANNRDCAYSAAPYNVLGCTTYSTIYDSCYDGGSWHMEQDSSNPLLYHVTISDYTIDYKDYNFPTANNTWYARTSAGTVYTANQACLSAGTTQMVLQFPEDAVDAPTYIFYKMVADNFKVGGVAYDASAEYTNTYQLVPTGSIQSGTNFTDDTATTRAASGHQLGSAYNAGDAYSFIGTNIRLWGYQSTTTDEYLHTKATLIKFDADAFEINRDDQYYANGRYVHGSGSGTVHSFSRYFAGRSSNWADTQEMSDTLINSTDLHYYTDLDALESAGYTCVGVLYIADVEDINTSSQSFGMIGLTVKDESALIGNVYAACNDSWASYSTLEELEAAYGAPISGEGSTINTEWARNGYNLYKAYCSLSAYETMKTTIESGNRGDYWYHKTEYDEDGNIIGGHNVGYYGGTSLLICGEKSTVEIKTDRTVYDMDAGQRTAEVIVTPAVTVEGNASSETGDKGTTTTTATVKVTLPSDLTYDPGSACWGDTSITPEITTDADGNTVLTFVLEDVTLGETLDNITFNCTIGHAGTAEDVTNNESISINATIESTNDHRAKEESFGNSSTTSFNVIRLSATSIAKSVDNRMIEQDGSFTWTLNYYNGADEDISSTSMVDVFPKNEDELGSLYEGSISITGIEIDFSKAPNSYTADAENMHFYVSTDYSGTGSDLAGSETPTDWADLMTQSSASDYVVTLDTAGYEAMKAFYFDLGNLDTKETVTLRISVKTEGNEPGDIYNNLYYEVAANQGAAVQSNLVSTEVVQRNLSGRTWIDANMNGIQDDGEAALAGAKVTLYNEGGQAVDIYGNTLETVTTGEDGSYDFNSLPAGTYRVMFEVDGTSYALTKANVGDDDTVDSDAEYVSNNNGDLVAEITDISLPEIADMDSYIYDSEHHDAGYYNIINISVTKIWDDADNEDGIRPDSITIRLLANDKAALDDEGNEITATVTADNNWSWTFTGLPRNDENGKRITYTVTEDSIDGYGTKVTEPVLDSSTGMYTVTVTNKYTPETINISGSKTWDDANNQDGKRPKSITIRLLADGTEVESMTVDATDKWAWTFTDLPKYRDQGVEIVYTITEDAVSDYESSVDGYNVTNTYTPETIDITGTKTWDDDDDRDGDRPESLTIRLLADGEEIENLTVSEADGWSWSFTDLPKYRDGGVEIVYTVTEDANDEYKSEYDGYDVTNTHTPERTSLTVTKVWNDNADQDGIRPDSVTVELLADGVETGDTLVLNDTDGWTGTFTNLYMYEEHGERIAYTVEEKNVPDGYVVAIDGDATKGYTVTNTHTADTVDISGSKTWDDADDQDGIRPNSVTIYLYADGDPALDENFEAIKETVTAEDDWTWTFTNLPEYRDGGVEIVYTVSEKPVPDGYEATVDGMDITNTHTPETIDIPVVKIWEDDDNAYSHRPDSIDVALWANGEDTGETITLDESNDWSGTFTDEDKYKAGERILYTVKEISDETLQYYTPKITYEDDGSVTIVNLRKYFDIDEEIVPDEDDRDTWVKNESVNEYNTIELEMSTYLPVIEPDELGNGQFTMNFHEVLDSELNLDEIEGDFSVAIAGLRIDPMYYTVEIYPDDGCSFHVIVDLTALYRDGVITDDDLLGDTEIMVFFYADLEGTGLNGTYKSTVWYEVYDGDELQYTSSEDVVYVYTYDISIVKYDAELLEGDDYDAAALEGATLGLYYDAEGENAVSRNDEAYTGISGEDGLVEFYGLAAGTYYVKEIEAPTGYDLSDEVLTVELGEDLDENGYKYEGVFANTPETLGITVTKVWDDENDADGIRPVSVNVELIKNGESTGRVMILSEENDWTGTFINLDAYTNGTENVYTVEETEVEGYTGTVSGSAEDGYVITNKHTPGEVNPTPKSNPGTGNPDNGNPTSGNPTTGSKTGDTNMVYLWIILIIAAAALAVAGVTLRTRNRVRR